jgi:pimeloyl-ACP methyl ester carboxylesterase
MAFQVPVDAREERRARNVGLAMAILSGLLIGLLVYLSFAGFVGSDELVNPRASAVCRLPSSLGMTYEAINYDIASDAALASEPDADHCATDGQPAGTALVTSDGVRIAGWYIPAAAAVGPNGPTVVLVHPHARNKNAMLPYAAFLHPDYNLVLFDQRNHGQSFGTSTTGGVTERLDLEAVVGWLQATHAPGWIGVMGSSMGGIAAASAVAEGLPVQALVLDSTPIGVADATQRQIQQRGFPLALPASWSVMLASLFRTGVDVTAAEPIATIDGVGGVPVLIIQGSDDHDMPPDAADQLAAEARKDGVTVEVQYCPGAGHGDAVELCADAYRDWVLGFLARSRAT